MPNASAARLFRRATQAVHHYLAETLRLCAVYLGIAVIVTVSTGFALPGLRGQALQVHEALLTAFAPSSLRAGAGADAGFDADSASAIALVIPAAPASNATGLLGPARGKPAAPRTPAITAITATGPQAQALRNYIARKYKVAYEATGPLLNTVYQAGREKRLDPLLLLAVIAIESRYNPLAESNMGAQGLMQVMTSVHQDKFDAIGKNPLDPNANIAVGATILRDCINRRGSVDSGLACYVGATGPDDNGYGAKVQAERRRLALASGIALARD